MGEVGVTASDPDMAALDVLGDVLNSFGGRLFDRIRSREVLRFAWHRARLCAALTSGSVEKEQDCSCAREAGTVRGRNGAPPSEHAQSQLAESMADQGPSKQKH